jgi:NCAIR mutase (PurE)-related protein
MKPPRIKGFLLNGEEVTRRVATFDPAMTYLDVMAVGDDDLPVIENGKPVTERLHGEVQIEWDLGS